MGNTVSIDGLRPEVWRRKVWREVEDELYFVKNGMMVTKGSAEDKANGIIAYMDDLSKQNGDQVTFGLTYKLGQNSGVTGDNELEGNESQISSYSEAVAIDQWRDAVRLTGKLDEQKNSYDQRENAKGTLATRESEMIEKQIFIKLAGVTNTSLTDVNGSAYCGTFADGVSVHAWSNTPDAIPDADMAAGFGSRYLCANSGGGDGLTTADLLDTTLLTRAKNKGRLANPRIRPVIYKGKAYYVVFVHPWQFTDLQNNAVIAQSLRDAWWRGEENPLFSGASLVWNGMIIHEHEYVPFLDVSVAGNNFTAAGAGEDFAVDTFRALLVGAQACGVAACKEGPNWTEKSFDYENKWAVSCGWMGGVQKLMFNSLEFGVIAIDTYATPQ